MGQRLETPLTPGESGVVEVKIDKADIDKFAEAIHSHHPIHTDPEWTKTYTPFGARRLVHGFMTASLVSQPLSKMLLRKGVPAALHRVDLKVVHPVYEGDQVTMELEYVASFLR